jgi:copper chaperone CopZ
VDIYTPNKTLTVETSDASAEEIEAAVQEAGFKAERV